MCVLLNHEIRVSDFPYCEEEDRCCKMLNEESSFLTARKSGEQPIIQNGAQEEKV